MRYSVEVIKEGQAPQLIDEGVSRKSAVETACIYRHAGGQVYISWYRNSDGQKGYLNPGGEHAIIGKPW